MHPKAIEVIQTELDENKLSSMMSYMFKLVGGNLKQSVAMCLAVAGSIAKDAGEMSEEDFLELTKKMYAQAPKLLFAERA